ncbi:hypothetical protein [Bacillus sp. EAC]|uniref:hypothetical protein n=1 Tax=Bacillus sp. EAC TaxID=1978338 RepID=UPI000B43B7FA|nr:hypothetical protein [Bacillus sp. EAC]
MWGFCGCNRRREERREDRREVRDTREWTSVRKSCNSCHEDDGRVFGESMNNDMNDNMNDNMNTRNRGGGCRRNRNSNMVSPSSSFCNTQLEAARSSCHANPLTNFSGCERNM